uniref:carbonic anhydrase n=1 Tax=Castellaniella defragrans TaxID=75697 RepID=UPI00333F521A
MKLHRAFVASLFATALPLLACAHEAGTPPHWGYAGEANPGHWGALSEDYKTCSLGASQSPIDIQDTAAIRASLPKLDVHYQPFPLEIVNNGHSVQVTASKGNGFTVDGHEFKLLQFHFHAPSEYTLNGKAYPMEMHLVHQREDGALAVIGVLFKSGAYNPALDRVFSHLPAAKGEPQTFANVAVNINDLLPKDRHYYRLMGSLTTPPCSEGVSWFVMQAPVTASEKQIQEFAQLFPEGNARPVQATNNRLVVKGSR